MAKRIETRNWFYIEFKVLEFFGNSQRKSVSHISWDSNHILLTQIHSTLKRISWSDSSPFCIGNYAVSITHEQQCFVRVDSIQSGDFGVAPNIEQKHDKTVFNLKRPLSISLISGRFDLICKLEWLCFLIDGVFVHIWVIFLQSHELLFQELIWDEVIIFLSFLMIFFLDLRYFLIHFSLLEFFQQIHIFSFQRFVFEVSKLGSVLGEIKQSDLVFVL